MTASNYTVTLGLAALGASFHMTLGSGNAEMNKDILALQTWTVREPLRLDPAGTLSEISKIGFTHLELAGNAGRSPQAFAELCREHGFTVIGVHQPPLTSGDLEGLLEEAIEACNAYDCSHVTVMLDEDDIGHEESYVNYAQLCSEAAAQLNPHKIRLSYHCYPFDLVRLEEIHPPRSGLDVLVERTSGEELSFQLDTHFLYRAQMPLKQFLERCGARCKLVHVNDIDEDGRQAVLGKGTIAWNDLLALLEEVNSTEWLILEHSCSDPLRWIRESYEYWRTHVSSR